MTYSLKSLPVIFVFLLLICSNFSINASQEPTQEPSFEDLTKLTIADMKRLYADVPGKADFYIGQKLLGGLGVPEKRPDKAFELFMQSGKYIKKGRDLVLRMCNAGYCNTDIIEKNSGELLDLARQDNQDAFSLLYRLADSNKLNYALKTKILDALEPIYKKEPRFTF